VSVTLVTNGETDRQVRTVCRCQGINSPHGRSYRLQVEHLWHTAWQVAPRLHLLIGERPADRPSVAYFRFDLGRRSRATSYREREARFASRLGVCLTDSFGMNTSAGSSNRALNLRTCSKVRLRCPVMNIETALSEPN